MSPARGQLLRWQMSSAEERLRWDAGCQGAQRGWGLAPIPVHPSMPAGSPVPAGGCAGGNGLISHFLRIVHLNNNKKAIGLKCVGIMRRSGDVSMCKRLIKIETQDTSTDANYLGWQIKESNFPSERLITCLVEGEGWQAAAVGQAGREHAGPHLAAGQVLAPVSPWAGIAVPEASPCIRGVPPSQLGDRWRDRA